MTIDMIGEKIVSVMATFYENENGTFCENGSRFSGKLNMSLSQKF